MDEEATLQKPLSKSQKKRLRQRQKSKRQAEAAAVAAAASEEDPVSEPKVEQPKIQDPLNPHEKLRQDLLSRGYSAEEIDAGMDEMWNLDMQYDELESVVSFLDRKRELWAQEVQQESAAAAVAVKEAEEPEVEEEEEAVVFFGEDESSPAPPDKMEEESGLRVEEQQQRQQESTADAEQQQEEPMAMDLASKLEVVANFENLQDALFALSQWVTKAAKVHELFDLCNASSATGSTSPSPLHIMLKRCILFEEDGDNSFAALLPFIHSLLSGLLTVCSGSNNTPPASAGVEDILAIIHFTRKTISDSVALMGHLSAQNDVADSVSRTVTAIIYKNLSVATTTINTSNIFLQPSSSSVQSRIKKFHDEINELVSSSKGVGGGGIVELMTDRDCRKLAAEKACDLSQMILHAGSSSDDMGSFRKNRDTALLLSSDEKANLISAIMGEHYSSIQKGVRDFKDIQSRMETLQAELSIKHTEVAAESLTLQSELERVARRKEELKLELEQLERQELLMQKRDAELNAILSNAKGGSDMAYLQSQRDEAMKMVRVDDAVRKLVDKLGQFEISSSPSSPEPVQNGDPGFEEIPKDAMESNFDLMMLQMKNYFQAEATAVNFLEKRVLSLQGEYKDLQRETAQFTALGLTTNVSKMNQSLEEISRNISDDQTVLSALRSESEKMQNILIDRIQDYVSVMKTSISSTHEAMLADLVKSMSIIGINSTPTSIFSQHNGGSGVGALNLTSSPVVVETGVGARITPKQPVGATGGVTSIMPSQAAAPASRVVQQKSAPVEPPKPRLGWAVRNGTGPVKKKEVKSFLDIQKEEMSAKMS